jgi:exopolysaccharide biosynthesis protein
MTKAIPKKILTDKILFLSLVSVCFSLIALYMYFVSASVLHVVMRTEVSQQNTKIASDISALESKYIAAQHRVSSDIASLEGYHKTEKKVFINRGESSLVLNTALGR